MKKTPQNLFTTSNGYMTEKIRSKYIAVAEFKKILPEDAHRRSDILSLNAPEGRSQPIQFWQLFSVLGPDRIVRIVENFYERVFADEEWFSSVFSSVNSINGHIRSQAAMWADVMGGGQYYHGGEYRLSFHHSHNAMALMNDKGAKRWCDLMLQTLDDPGLDLTDDPRVRRSLNTFLSFFMDKYAQEFSFEETGMFGETNPPFKRRINLMNLSDDDIQALSEAELGEALSARGLDLALFPDKQAMVRKAQSL